MTGIPFAATAETHSAVVFFVGDRAYKLKKPVRMAFLDFSTREARERVCHREVELNRRLAPDVYLGVADVLGPDGTAWDHLVVMRRMPEDRRLSRLVAAGADVGDGVRDIARAVAAFHARADSSPEVRAAGRPEAVGDRIRTDVTELRAAGAGILDPERVDAVAALADAYLAGRTALLDGRAAGGFVRDGHGDLLTDDVFLLEDGPRILDCIEFDDRLRHTDVLADTAFLAMDLERIGAPGLATRFLDWYDEFSGTRHPPTLTHLYIAARAVVRSKVACIRAGQGDAEKAAEATGLLDLAYRHLRAGRVVLTVVGGSPGTGKSTLAAGIADARGWSRLRSDEIRKDLAGLAHSTDASASYGEGLYSPARSDAVYDELLRRARRLLELGEPVVLDASFTTTATRREAAELAAATHSAIVELRCDAPADVVRARVETRRARGDDASDADPAIAERLAHAADPWPGAVTVDTGSSADASLAAALAAIDASG